MSLWTSRIGVQGAIVPIVVAPSVDDLVTLELEGKVPPRLQRVRALADTGANRTCVHPAVFQALGLYPTRAVDVTVPSTGAPSTRSAFEIALAIPGGAPGEPPLVIEGLVVVATELRTAFGVQALLGRDVLERCLLIYHGPEQRFTLAY